MKKGNSTELAAALYQILSHETDEDHLLSLADIQSDLEDLDIYAERRSVYEAMHVLKKYGAVIHYVRKNGGHWYYMEPVLTNAEAKVLLDSAASSAFSEEETKHLIKKIKDLSSPSMQNEEVYIPKHITQESFLSSIDLILKAVKTCHTLRFRYFETTITKEKKYHHNGEFYQLDPYAIVSQNGRYYVVFYSTKYRSFSNYRLDRMDDIEITDHQYDTVPFSLEDYMMRSVNMYPGKAQTITADFDLSMASQVFDEFGDNLIVSKVTDHSFTASIRTAVTPTLISWLLQFGDKVIIRKPDNLIQDLLNIADTIQKTYN